ncbi:adenylate/guanylate cyclase domain-containing protein [Chitinimonas lacunae]|uniref:Adenylate/guanylate cyclase domain-containing protein n=1 Tax=Chitinimonas lacunae TaxID=1963018 RepID=A0ABV8MQP1_9NEIS
MPDRDDPDVLELRRLLDLHRGDLLAAEAAVCARFARLQAVMFTDLVGFSRRVEAFGIVHFLRLIYASERLFLPAIAEHGGRALKRDGDSLLSLFDSPTDALACALALQRACAVYNDGCEESERLDVCIGIGYGEVLCVGRHEVWGAEVNAAAKLGEDHACGGETLVTEAVRAAGTAAGYRFIEQGTLFGARLVFRLDGVA